MSVSGITVNNNQQQAKVELRVSAQDVDNLQLAQGDGAKFFNAGAGVKASREALNVSDGTVEMVTQSFGDGAGTIEFFKKGQDGKFALLGHEDAVKIGEMLLKAGLKQEAPNITRTLDDAIQTSKQTGQVVHAETVQPTR